MSDESLRRLTLDHVNRPESVLLLGALAAKSLQREGVFCVCVGADGSIELVDPIELGADALPEETAIASLHGNHGYTDDRLVAYLKAREARKRARDATHLRPVSL